MDVNKSSRHAKITGDFGEALVLYWLSKYGFECARVDHTGIDLIARNPHTHEIMGISVKCRCRKEGTEGKSVNIAQHHIRNADEACNAFGCKLYFAIVVDAGDRIRVYMVPRKRMLALLSKSKTPTWRMSEEYLDHYSREKQIQAFEFRTSTKRWWAGHVRNRQHACNTA
ncbi:MAG: hypothetical protein NTW87_17835 [Planctomycetota bacterium]|nr:hypothetical protein [Planctomycetota bacterium]